MILSVLKESKKREGRVALIPKQVRELVHLGHRVYVQKNAGCISHFLDADYHKAGAAILESKSELIKRADLVLKVKEPTFEELDLMRRGQMIFCFLHLAASPKILKKILQKKITALGYETVQLKDGSLPLLKPMSEIAGKLATQNGAHHLRFDQGGRGVLLGGTEKIPPARVLVLGGGVVGEAAAKMALGMGAHTIVLDISRERLAVLRKKYGEKLKTQLSNRKTISKLIREADLVIGAVLIPGAKAPKLVTQSMVKSMKKGAVIVDVSVDQGGCIETSEVTTHMKPIFVKYGVLHYGVANIPGSVPLTGTMALTQATFFYIKNLTQLGLENCCRKYPEMKKAINCANGEIRHQSLRMCRTY